MSSAENAAPLAEPIVLPGLPIIDPHVHLWNIRGYDYFVPELMADFRSGHNVVASVHVECGMAYSDDPRPEFRCVGETAFVVEQIRAADTGDHDLAAGIVGFGDLRLGERLAPVLDAHKQAGEGRFRGVRSFIAWHPDPAIGYPNIPRYAQGNVMADPAFLAGAKAVAEAGLVIDLWVYHSQLADAVAFLRTCPDVPILLNHCGGPLGVGPYAGRRDEVFAAWADQMVRIAELPNVRIKLSGLGMHRTGLAHPEPGKAPLSDRLAALWKPYLRTCVDLFGTDRAIFASNFPVDRDAAPYAVLVNAYKKALSDLSQDELAAIFAGNAASFYKI